MSVNITAPEMDSGMGTTTENSGAPSWALPLKERTVKKTKRKSKKSDLVLPEIDNLILGNKKKSLKKLPGKKSWKDENDKTNNSKNLKNLKNPYNSIVSEKIFYTVCEPRNFPYNFMLQRLHDSLSTLPSHSSLSTTQISLPTPKMLKIGNRKSQFNNFGETARSLNRSPEHLQDFITQEVAAFATMINDKEHLVIKGFFKPGKIQRILRNYIKEYVQCSQCKSGNTVIEKIDRLSFVSCLVCFSKKNAKAMEKGFLAKTKLNKKYE